MIPSNQVGSGTGVVRAQTENSTMGAFTYFEDAEGSVIGLSEIL